MCEALKELMKDEIEAARKEGWKGGLEGRPEGRLEGRYDRGDIQPCVRGRYFCGKGRAEARDFRRAA